MINIIYKSYRLRNGKIVMIFYDNDGIIQNPTNEQRILAI